MLILDGKIFILTSIKFQWILLIQENWYKDQFYFETCSLAKIDGIEFQTSRQSVG